MKIKEISILAIMCLMVLSCGYHLVGTGGLPQGVSVLAIPLFEKGDNVVVLDQRITEAVRAEISRRARVKVISQKEGSDAILLGTIANYSVFPISYGSDGRANRYRVSIVAKVLMKDKEGKEIFKMDGYRFEKEYSRASSQNLFLNEENIAVDLLSRDFARDLVGAILESNL
ncbi:MAG: LPS assembly lipoprotein LptE [Acidobacteriota bacterium]|nr:LptE family protein [Thermoanaerobaculaceae bacterium]